MVVVIEELPPNYGELSVGAKHLQKECFERVQTPSVDRLQEDERLSGEVPVREDIGVIQQPFANDFDVLLGLLALLQPLLHLDCLYLRLVQYFNELVVSQYVLSLLQQL